MERILSAIKLEHRWDILLYLGMAACLSSMIHSPDFLVRRHLFTLGIGLLLVHVAFALSYKSLTGPKGLSPEKDLYPGVTTSLIFLLGFITAIYSVVTLIWGLR